MSLYKIINSFKKIFTNFIFIFLLTTPTFVYASFIESTLGTAVVNDATATYYNPAALITLKNPQIIGLGSFAKFKTNFNGQVTQSSTGITQSGSSSSITNYKLPSLYLGSPLNNKFSIGFAVISNFFNNDMEANSILRYLQSDNKIENFDLVPAFGVKINDALSIGANISISKAKFITEPIIGFPTFHIPDAQAHNEVVGTGVGGDVGLLYRASKCTLIGFNYRSVVTYPMKGKSVLDGPNRIISRNYHFNFWTPARLVLSISQSLTEKLGIVSTIERIKWSIFDSNTINNFANVAGIFPIIIPRGVIHYHMRDTWLLTLGSQYKITPKWLVRIAGTYNQSPSNPSYQISTGDSFILGGSMGYALSKNFILDGSYAHAFIKNQTIRIASGRNLINGINQAVRDSVSLKLTINIT